MSKLEIVTHVCLIALCITCGIILVTRQSTPPRLDPKALIGKRIKVPEILQDKAPPLRLVLAMTTVCPYCKASMPFYRELVALRQRGESAVPFIVVSPDSIDDTKAYLAEQELAAEKVVHADLSDLNVPVTPALLVIDDKGVIKKTFIGQQKKSGEDEVLALMRAGRISD